MFDKSVTHKLSLYIDHYKYEFIIAINLQSTIAINLQSTLNGVLCADKGMYVCVWSRTSCKEQKVCACKREKLSESEKKTLALEFAAVVPTMSLLANAQCV